MKPVQVLQAGGVTDKGPRSHNEDSYWLAETNSPVVAKQGHLYIVSDGVGGQAAGEQASSMAVTLIPEYYYAAQQSDPQANLQEALKRTNQDIYHAARADERYRGMACTLTAVLIHNNEAVVANAGDSRAYLIRGGTIRQVTQDHTWVTEQVQAGILTPEEAHDHARKNVVTRSLGPDLTVNIDFFTETLRPGDRLVLCTDGLSNVVSKPDIVRIVNRGVNANQAAKRLVTLALQRETQDNLTCLVISLGTTAEGLSPSGGKIMTHSRLSRALIVGLGAVILLLLILGSLFWLNRSPGLEAAAGTPAEAPTVTLANPTVTNSPTLAAPASTVASPLSTGGVSATTAATQTAVVTVTKTAPDGIDPGPGPPAPAVILKEPVEGSSIESGTEVTLAWEWSGEPEPGIDRTFRVLVRNQVGENVKDERTTGTRLSYSYLPPGDYTWLISALETTQEDGDEQEIARSKVGHFSIISPSPTPTFTPILTSTPTSTGTPVSSPISTSTVVTSGQLAIVEPIEVTTGETTFKWSYEGLPLQPNQGFEVRIWRIEPGQPPGPPLGIHNAVEDNQNGNIKSVGNHQYELTVDISGSEPVGNQGGSYQWAVYLIEINPYRELGSISEPSSFEFKPLPVDVR